MIFYKIDLDLKIPLFIGTHRNMHSKHANLPYWAQQKFEHDREFFAILTVELQTDEPNIGGNTLG